MLIFERTFPAEMVDIKNKRPVVRLQDHRSAAFSKIVLFLPLLKLRNLIEKIEQELVKNPCACNCKAELPKWGVWISGFGFYDW